MKTIHAVCKSALKYFGFVICLFVLIERSYSSPLNHAIEPTGVYPVVNNNAGQRKISKNGLSAIFKMRLRHWSDGSDVTVFVLPDDDPLHKKFCKQILNVFPHQMRKNWNKLVFSGTGQAPTVLESKEDMIEKLRTTPGAVGYLSGNDVTKGIDILDIE